MFSAPVVSGLREVQYVPSLCLDVLNPSLGSSPNIAPFGCIQALFETTNIMKIATKIGRMFDAAIEVGIHGPNSKDSP